MKNPKFGPVSWLLSEISKNQFLAILGIKLWMDLAAIFFKLNFFLFSKFWHQSRWGRTTRSGSNFKLKFFSEKVKNVLLTKNLQFLSDFAQKFRDCPENFWDHLTKFELNRTKIVDFSLIAKFWQKIGY